MASEFHKLVKEGNLAGVKEHLDNGFKPSDMDAEQFDLLYNALLLPAKHTDQEKTNKADMFKLLLEHDPSVLHHTDKHGYSLAHFLARFGYDTVLATLIQQGKGDELMIPEKRLGTLPIHSAIINEKITTVELLLTIPGMSVVEDLESRNIIHYAARHSTEAMVRCCCEHPKIAGNIRSLVSAKDNAGQTPAGLLYDYNTTGDVEEIMDILAAKGAERINRLPSPFRTTFY